MVVTLPSLLILLRLPPSPPPARSSSDHAESFLGWLDEHDVMWTLYPLKNITDEGAAKSAKVRAARMRVFVWELVMYVHGCR